MKKLLLIMALVLGTALVVPTTGCKTTTGKTVVYNSLYTVEKVTTAAYDAYSTGVIKGTWPITGVAKVSAAYNQFQNGVQVALQAAQFNWQAPAPVDLTNLSNGVLAAITQAKGNPL
jgi:hypothetical protein